MLQFNKSTTVLYLTPRIMSNQEIKFECKNNQKLRPCTNICLNTVKFSLYLRYDCNTISIEGFICSLSAYNFAIRRSTRCASTSIINVGSKEKSKIVQSQHIALILKSTPVTPNVTCNILIFNPCRRQNPLCNEYA